MPPFMLEAHELRVGDQFDVAWKLRADSVEEQKLRTERNQLIMEQLQAGKTVAMRRSPGWPLYPRVWSNDLCIFAPVCFGYEAQEGDIVFCKAQPQGQYDAYLVRGMEWNYPQHSWVYWISTLSSPPKATGYCYLTHIGGKLTQVLK